MKNAIKKDFKKASFILQHNNKNYPKNTIVTYKLLYSTTIRLRDIKNTINNIERFKYTERFKSLKCANTHI